MKLQVSILYNSGIEKVYNMVQTNNDQEITKEDLQESIKVFEDEYIEKAYNTKDVAGYFNLINDNNESVTIHLKQTSEIRFKIIDDMNEKDPWEE